MVIMRDGGFLAQGSSLDMGYNAHSTIGAGITVVSDLLRTTLGPRGSDKMMVSTGPHGDLKITNDGATIMKHLNIQNPSAKLFAEMSQTQDKNSGDGTTSVVVIASAVYKACMKLIEEKHLHPQVIASGLNKVKNSLIEALDMYTYDFKSMDEQKATEILMKMAMTSLNSKIVARHRKHFAEIVIEATKKVGFHSMSAINIIQKEGAPMEESKIIDGFLLDTKMGMGQTKCIKNPKIMVANTQLDADKVKVFGATVKTNKVSKLQEIEEAEKKKMIEKIDAIASHKPDVFINRQLIYDFPEQLFQDRGILSIEHADFEGVERLSYVLNAELASTFSENIGTSKIKLGTCEKIEERADLISGKNDPMILFSGVPAKGGCTVILRGATDKLLAEIERSFHDALCVVFKAYSDRRYMLGAGCIDALLSKHLADAARSDQTVGIEKLIFEEISQAMLEIPTVLCENCGLDPASIIAQLKTAAESGSKTTGINLDEKMCSDVEQLGIFESRNVRESALLGAFEAVTVLLRIDGIVTTKPYQRKPDMRNH